MDHTQFKANQTAAEYVADGLDERTQEAFEQHLMGCTECVEDVESWRAIKLAMPQAAPAARPAVAARRFPAVTDWRMAASLLGAGVVGATSGWIARSGQATDLDSTHTVVFNVPSVTRGADECANLRLATDTQVAVVRVPGVARDLRVIALDSQGHELPGGAGHTQPDGSQLLRIESQLLKGHAVQLEARHADGSTEPLSCVTGEIGSEVSR
jgi:anti-sigma factor RsiW